MVSETDSSLRHFLTGTLKRGVGVGFKLPQKAEFVHLIL